MIILFSTNTNEGGARICVEHWIRLLRESADIYFLSGKAHREIGLDPNIFHYSRFSNEWAVTNNIKICDDIRKMPSDTILIEVNNSCLWKNSETIKKIRKIRKRVTFNNIAWLDGHIHPEHSKFIKNYLGYYVPSSLRSLLENIYHFTNINEVMQYIDYDFMNVSGDISLDRKLSVATSLRKDSNKISPSLLKKLKDIMSLYDVDFKFNDFKFNDHSQYLRWIKNSIRGYLHFQDQWVETFGYSLYEGIKLCDFVLYKPEPYCDKMIQRLSDEDKRKIIYINDESELSMALIKKDFIYFPKTTEIHKDIYMNKNYIKSKFLSVLEGLHEV